MHKFLILLLLLASKASAFEVNVLLANRDIKKGEFITQDDVRAEVIESKRKQGYITTLDNRKIKATSNIKAGEPLRVSQITIDKFLVHSGDTVKVKFIRGSMVIETLGIAIGNGEIDDIVKVRSLDSNKVINGRVAAEKTVIASK